KANGRRPGKCTRDGNELNHMNRSLVFVFTLFVLCSCAREAYFVSGTIYGKDHQPLVGCSVDYYSGGRRVNGTIADEQGQFNCRNLSDVDSLVFTYVGYSAGSYRVRHNAFIR